MAFAGGTDAMDAWKELVNMPEGPDRNQLRKGMLEYCMLDTYAMVRIFNEMERLIKSG